MTENKTSHPEGIFKVYHQTQSDTALTESARRSTLRQLKGYKFYIRISISHPFLNLLTRLDLGDGACDASSGDTLFHDGPRELLGIPVWIVDRHKKKVLYFYFKTKEDAKLLESKVTKLTHVEYVRNPFNCVCELGRNGWGNPSKKRYVTTSRDNLIGYGDYVDKIVKDIAISTKYQMFLSSMGERHTLNYLLYGPPGVGKTTLIKTVATQCQLPMYVVRGTDLLSFDVNYILNPTIGPSDDLTQYRILLFEDFDCFLELTSKTTMADVLNAIDGVVSEIPTIRFFTGNDCNVIFGNAALLSRMTDKFRFVHSSLEHYQGKLEKFLTYYTPDKIDKVKLQRLLDLVETRIVPRHVSLRTFSAYVARYLFDENFLDAMADHLGDLTAEYTLT